MTTFIFLFILIILTIIKLFIQGLFLIHRLQQLGYHNLKLIKWLEGNHYRNILLWNIFELLLPFLIIYILYSTIQQISIYKYLTSIIMILTLLWKILHQYTAGWMGYKSKLKEKMPLKYTPRVIRLLISLLIVIFMSLSFIL